MAEVRRGREGAEYRGEMLHVNSVSAQKGPYVITFQLTDKRSIWIQLIEAD